MAQEKTPLVTLNNSSSAKSIWTKALEQLGFSRLYIKEKGRGWSVWLIHPETVREPWTHIRPDLACSIFYNIAMVGNLMNIYRDDKKVFAAVVWQSTSGKWKYTTARDDKGKWWVALDKEVDLSALGFMNARKS